jgi:uncharacterized membrane protein YfcA
MSTIPHPEGVVRPKTSAADAAAAHRWHALFAYMAVALGVFVGWLLYDQISPNDFIPAAGVSVFALLYIFAQGIERGLEPISRLFREEERALNMWAAACFLAMLASGAFGVFMLHAVGVTSVRPAVDIAITGLAIGSGTKPLHDLISKFEKSS